ncbi:MAG TPA: hypothetical protein VGI70_01890 [Polyangiales bacterium]
MRNLQRLIAAGAAKWALAGVGLAVALFAMIAFGTAAQTPAPAPPLPAPEPIAPTKAPPPKPDAAAVPAPAPAPQSDVAHITFSVVPAVYATVFWGKKVLGQIAPRQVLVVTRKRDSGPLDVIVRANGYLPVQVRAHTFTDTRVAVKLTRPEQENTLLGYRLPIDAGAPDSGENAPPPSPNEAIPQPPL